MSTNDLGYSVEYKQCDASSDFLTLIVCLNLNPHSSNLNLNYVERINLNIGRTYHCVEHKFELCDVSGSMHSLKLRSIFYQFSTVLNLEASDL